MTTSAISVESNWTNILLVSPIPEISAYPPISRISSNPEFPGGNYSEYAYDIKGATRNNIVYPSYDPMIFEVRFPTTDIKGRITTL